MRGTLQLVLVEYTNMVMLVEFTKSITYSGHPQVFLQEPTIAQGYANKGANLDSRWKMLMENVINICPKFVPFTSSGPTLTT